ncbi:MAG: hypothetical protein RLZZ546_2121, partial [Bacteroidota bacterium]
MYILFPGRHHLLTKFQHEYLNAIIEEKKYISLEGKSIAIEKIDAIIFAVTSSNHSNTRRNPLPFHLRAIQIEKFSEGLNTDSLIYGIDDIGQNED